MDSSLHLGVGLENVVFAHKTVSGPALRVTKLAEEIKDCEKKFGAKEEIIYIDNLIANLKKEITNCQIKLNQNSGQGDETYLELIKVKNNRRIEELTKIKKKLESK